MASINGDLYEIALWYTNEKVQALTTCLMKKENGRINLYTKCVIEHPNYHQVTPLCKCLHFPSPGEQEVELSSFLLGSIPPERLYHRDRSLFLPSFHGGSGIEEMRESLQESVKQISKKGQSIALN